MALETQRQQAALQKRLFGAADRPVHAGRFVIVDRIGRGGWGTVYRAYDPQLDRKVAVKVLNVRHHEGGADDLLAEAKALAKLTHPNVVTVHEVGTTADDQIFMAMEFVDGGTLRSRAEALSSSRTRITALVDLFGQACAGLHSAHRAGLVHRDLKPANLLVGEDDRLRIADFGMAHLASPTPRTSDTEDGMSTTQAGHSDDDDLAWIGTPAYMAPEQFRGHSDSAGDQFNLCAAFYEMLYGNRPFAGDSVLALANNAAEGTLAPTQRSDVPRWLRRIVLRGLSSDARDRYPDVAALRAALLRGQRTTRWSLATVGLGATAAVAAVAVGQAKTNRVDCEAESEAAAPEFSSDTQAAITAAFAATGQAGHQTAAAGIVRSLEHWRDRWLEQRVQACAASPRATEGPEASAGVEVPCLDTLATRFASLTTLLRDPDPAQIAPGMLTASTLTSPARCRGGAQGLEEALADAPAEVVEGVYTATNLQTLGRVDAAVRTLDALRPAIPANTEIAAMAECLAAGLAFTQIRLPDAQAHVEACMQAAELGGYNWVETESWLLRFAVQSRLGHHEDALFAVERARSLARRGDVSALGRGRVQWRLALANRRLGRHDEALAAIEAAFETYARNGAPDHRLAKISCDWSESLFRAGRRDDAVRKAEECRALNVAAHGDNAPQVATPWLMLAQYRLRDGDYGGSLAAAESALAALDSQPWAPKRERWLALDQKAKALTKLGRLDEVPAIHTAAREVVAELYGPDSPQMMSLHNEIANLHKAQRDSDRAATSLYEATAIAERGAAKRAPENAGIVYLNLAKTEATRRRPDDAARALKRARALLDPLRPDDASQSIQYHLNIAEVHARLESFADADASLSHARRLVEAQGAGASARMRVWRADADIRHRQGDVAGTASSYRRAREIMLGDAALTESFRARSERWAEARGLDPRTGEPSARAPSGPR